MYWWDSEARENVFMEITHRIDIGRDLNAPLAARQRRWRSSWVEGTPD
jgi:hypothetical protein